MRACIGRAFAWQEMQLVLISIIQKFDLELVDPSYSLQLKQALTIKPDNFQIRASLRTDKRIRTSPSAALRPRVEPRVAAVSTVDASQLKEKLYVLYGSNTGTSQAFAQQIAAAGPAYGETNRRVPFLTSP